VPPSGYYGGNFRSGVAALASDSHSAYTLRAMSTKEIAREGKPCPTCYAQMTLDGQSQWMCAKHGEPTKP
jgi:hypothetical protein